MSVPSDCVRTKTSDPEGNDGRTLPSSGPCSSDNRNSSRINWSEMSVSSYWSVFGYWSVFPSLSPTQRLNTARVLARVFYLCPKNMKCLSWRGPQRLV